MKMKGPKGNKKVSTLNKLKKTKLNKWGNKQQQTNTTYFSRPTVHGGVEIGGNVEYFSVLI